jgi:nucleoside-diphosphate-sugar epimerase
MLSGRPCTIHGGPEDTRDLLYVEDAAHALAAASERGDGAFVEIGSGATVTLADLHARLAELTRSRYEAIYAGGPGRAQRALDIAAADELLGWAPATSLEEGLKQTVAWFRG